MPWFNNHLRFVVAVSPEAGVFQPWTFLIVGSKHLTDPTAFLQVASWDNNDGTTGTNEFKFYQVNPVFGPQANLDRGLFKDYRKARSSQAGPARTVP